MMSGISPTRAANGADVDRQLSDEMEDTFASFIDIHEDDEDGRPSFPSLSPGPQSPNLSASDLSPSLDIKVDDGAESEDSAQITFPALNVPALPCDLPAFSIPHLSPFAGPSHLHGFANGGPSQPHASSSGGSSTSTTSSSVSSASASSSASNGVTTPHALTHPPVFPMHPAAHSHTHAHAHHPHFIGMPHPAHHAHPMFGGGLAAHLHPAPGNPWAGEFARSFPFSSSPGFPD